MKLSLFPTLICLTTFFVIGVNCHSEDGLNMKYYHESCPNVEIIVRNVVWGKVAQNPSLAAKLLRLHYHDCFVRGCDASILLDSTANNQAEKSAPPNLSLSGYDIIDAVKTELENTCPGIVSCADIVALAARDAVSYQFKRPMWQVLSGRKDGKISIASEAISNLPSSSANFTILLTQFQNKGLDLLDLVTLSGAHTIGVSHCGTISRRLFNFTGHGDTDPSINLNYAKFLKTQCSLPPNPSSTVEMDPTSSLTFDSQYYKSVGQNMGLFGSDATLLTNQNSARLVRLLQEPFAFFPMFASSMMKMGAMEVITSVDGEVRKNCRVIN